MTSIRTLDSGVSSLIAAGEIVERPSSVVKELVENSLDAGATRVAIDLVDGGKTSIRVDDDGGGIRATELPLAVENFSTSKIREVADLSRVETLGFRGEALASIRAVSALIIRSRARGEEIGRELRFRGAAFAGDVPCVRTPGTEVVVEQLFFNLPARRKFLRSGASELRRIAGVVQAYALSYPAVAFLLRDGGREICSYPVSRLDERVEIVLGGELAGHLARVEHEEGALHVSGYVSRPDFTRSNRSLQYFFVNRRFIRDRLLSHAVSLAYESLIPRNTHPAVVLSLGVPAGAVDVNVHPAKAEVRFRDEAEIHRIVRSAIRAALGAPGPGYAETVESIYRSIIPESGPAGSASPAAIPRELFDFPAGAAGPLAAAAESALREAPVPLFGPEGAIGVSAAGGLYWQLHQSFILIQIRGGLVIIDQHAAHERILFDRARASIAGSRALAQSLLFPAAITLSPDEFERYESLGGALASVGFDTEPFGPRSIIVRGIPAGVRNWNDGRLLQEIVGEGRSGVEGFLRSYACRAAIKAGTRLSAEEMESLADQLFATELPYTCPHGRPTMLRVSLAELERRFARGVSAERA